MRDDKYYCHLIEALGVAAKYYDFPSDGITGATHEILCQAAKAIKDLLDELHIEDGVMTDVIYALVQKKSRLCERKRAIKADADKQIKQIDIEIAEVDRAIETLNQAVKDYLCSDCRGTGSVRKCDAAGQMDDDICPRCHGTGVVV